MLETELKFLARDAEPLDALTHAETLGPARLGEPQTYDELDRYIDTADLRLAQQHWACRLRTRRGATIISLKGPAQVAAGQDPALHRRPEVEGPASAELDAASWPPSAARERLLALSADERLVERLALEQRRTERAVLLDGASIGVLSLDRVRVVQDATLRGGLWSVELESHGDEDVDLAPLAAALAQTTGLKADPLSKLEHALAMAGEPDHAVEATSAS